MSSIIINYSKCLAPRKKGSYEQCPHRQCLLSQFCGKHKNVSRRIDEILQSAINKSNLSMTIIKKNISQNMLSNVEKQKDIRFLPTNKKDTGPHILELKDLDNIKTIYLRDLKFSLKKLNVSIQGKKRILFARLKNLYKMINNCKSNIDKLILVQRQVRHYLKNRRDKYKGTGFLNRKLCNNINDFYSLEKIENIHDDYFFSYCDNNNFVYGFDIRSFKKLIDNKGNNPYNRNKIPPRVINRLKKRISIMKQYNISLADEEDEVVLTVIQKLRNRITLVFQKIDDLNTAAGGTEVKWFMDLPNTHLKILYKELEDIWTYRAELTPAIRNRIVPGGNIFKLSVHKVFRIHNRTKLQYFVIGEIDKLVSQGVTVGDRNLGALWVLTCLVMVSPHCASSLPWLVQ